MNKKKLMKIIEESSFDCSAVDDYATVWKAIDADVLKQKIDEIKDLGTK